MGKEAIANPSIFIGTFEFSEPVTTITDLIFATVCWYAFMRFYKHEGLKTEAFRFFLFYFLFFGIGITCASILGHGLQAYISRDWKAVGWGITAIGVMFLEFGVLNLVSNMIKRNFKYFFRILIVLHNVALIALLINPETRDFRFSAANTVMGMVLISMSILIFHAIRMNSKGSWILISGITLAFSPLFIYIFKFSISRWFNYHDFSHLLLAASMFLTYKGAWRLGTKPSSV